METVKQSPEFVRLSLAGEMQLGFNPGRFYRQAKMTCINLLVHYPNGCAANCLYCGLSRERKLGETSFIHVKWPVYPLAQIAAKIAETEAVQRICISMITNKKCLTDILAIIKTLRTYTLLPISILVCPTIINEAYLQQLKNAGADKIGVAFDLPTEELFDKYRGKPVNGPHPWQTYWQVFADGVKVFGRDNVGSHFMVGMGETEQQMAAAFQRVHDAGGVNHLFSFLPEKGTAVEKMSPPPLDNYRRMQIACELIDAGQSSFSTFTFDGKGRITDFGVSPEVWERLITEGKAFMTRGCVDCQGAVACNRPYGDSYPGENLRNYPFRPNGDDIKLIRRQV